LGAVAFALGFVVAIRITSVRSAALPQPDTHIVANVRSFVHSRSRSFVANPLANAIERCLGDAYANVCSSPLPTSEEESWHIFVRAERSE
jgi:hypothetical protein